MFIPDVNVLVALFRADHRHHEVAAGWWRESANLGESFSVPDVVWSGFLRIVTNRRLSQDPPTFAQAWEFVRSTVAQPTHCTFVAHPRTLEELARIGGDTNAAGDLVSDAYIAACAAAYGATVVTFDRDFRKFDKVLVKELST